MDYFCPSPRTMMKNIKTIIFLLHVYQQKIHTTQTSGSVVSAFCTHYRPVSSSSSSFPLRVSDETRPAEVTTGISLPVDDNERGSTAAAAVANGGKITVDDIAKTLEGRLADLEKKQKSLVSRAKGPNWETSPDILVQGGSIKTWSFPQPDVERLEVLLKSDGRPLKADVELWQGPDNTPYKMKVYVEDGKLRPFSAIIETPNSPNSIAIRNIANMEFPMYVALKTDNVARTQSGLESSPRRRIQGGSVTTYPFDVMIDSVHILLETDGRPLNARIELLQGPNNNKQIIEIYTEDGIDRPFYAVMTTPGYKNVVRIVNTGPMEFPLTAQVEAFMIDTKE